LRKDSIFLDELECWDNITCYLLDINYSARAHNSTIMLQKDIKKKSVLKKKSWLKENSEFKRNARSLCDIQHSFWRFFHLT